MFIFSYAIFLFLFPQLSLSIDATDIKNSYYGKEVLQHSGGKDFKNALHTVLNSVHVKTPKEFDQIAEHCPTKSNECISAISHSYRRAREILFGQIYLENSNGKYWIESFYCDEVIDNSELPTSGQLGPDNIPSNEVMNTEHTWPQSLFTSNFPKEVQKTDLHALFPVRSRVNSTRGNRPFGYVVKETTATCKSAKFGLNSRGESVFEPGQNSKGNVARALFYFSTRYSVKIDPLQEEILREWHQLDPIDENEVGRHDEIFEAQNIRNPYIDHPEWVSQVTDF